MKDNNIKIAFVRYLYFVPDFSYMVSLYCPPPNPGRQLILYRISRWYSWGPEKENDLLTVIQAGGVTGELEFGPSESLCSVTHHILSDPSFPSQGMAVTASTLLSWQVMYVIVSLQWTPGLAGSYPAREAEKTKVGRRLCPVHSRQAEFVPSIATFCAKCICCYTLWPKTPHGISIQQLSFFFFLVINIVFALHWFIL